ncbi:MAG: aminopeptidase P family protein [Rickettsiales bacterium]
MSNKLLLVRKLLEKYGINAYLQPVHDEWMSEYPPLCNRRVEWLTGFTGSAGLAVVTDDKAVIFVDGRYTLQAKEQAGADYEIHNIADYPPEKWLAGNIPAGKKIGYDPKLYTRTMLKRFEKLSLIPVENLIDALWENRPPPPATPLFIHETKYSGESSTSKRSRVVSEIKKANADLLFLSAPENVNWLFNIRARDAENTPLCLASAILDKNGKAYIYLDEDRVSNKVSDHLGNDTEIISPENIKENLSVFTGKKILCDSGTTPLFIENLCVDSGLKVINSTDPCELLKAIKNPVELAGMRAAHIRDGLAVTKLLYWLSRQSKVSELDVVGKILELRTQNELFVEPSFDTIAGSGEHGAIVHYRATKESNRNLGDGELFLLDSGGQYYDGTTDITRTVIIGNPTDEHKRNFTLVLKGHIALACAIFPEGTTGTQLDVLARQYLWQAGLDYDHGTGHGVGCFLGVHEGPQRVSKRAGDVLLKSGMILSNEPGYYKTGEYGIRIENLVAVVEKITGDNNKKYLGFETITCTPMDVALINISMLTSEEKIWINNYHNWVREELSPYLDADETVWLIKACASL